MGDGSEHSAIPDPRDPFAPMQVQITAGTDERICFADAPFQLES